jgi:hypothetical protein
MLMTGCGGKTGSSVDEDGTGGNASASTGGSLQGGSGGSLQGGSGGRPGAGGVSTGGRGGASAGGSSSGGLAGEAGGGFAGGGGVPPSDGRCTTDADCWVFSCCTTCEAVAIGEPEPFNCSVVDCAGLGCAELGLGATEARCFAGRCVLNHSCNSAMLIEPALPPSCPAGLARPVNANGWGPCIPVTECAEVDSCAVCETAGLACVTNEFGGLRPGGQFTYHCVTLPTECNGAPSCACMQTCIAPHSNCTANGQQCVEFCPNC